MRIGIDARMLGPGFGLARYVQQIVLHLSALDAPHHYVLFLRQANWQAVKTPAETFAATPDTIGVRSNVTKVPADIPWYGWKEQLLLPKIIAGATVDLMHFPHWNIPILYRGPFVATIHDLTMFHYPRAEATTLGPLQYWIKDRAHRFVVRQAVRRAEHVIAASEYTKHDVHQTLGVSLERMTTIYQAPGSGFSASDLRSPTSVLEKYHVAKPYVLYVGAAYPHKNLAGLLRAWRQVEQHLGSAYELVLAGKRSSFYGRLLASEEMKRCRQVRYLGFVPDEDLSSLYRGARLFVYPSLYEGFGLPPLEALSSGVPVVSSNRSCLPEVLGEAALYADPENPAYLAAMIERALQNEAIRQEIQERAKETLARYSGKRMAEQTLAVYGSAMNGCPHDA